MNNDLITGIAKATELAALASYKLLGKGDKEAADNEAVITMRSVLNELNIDGEIVIGEGEIDEAPMLYIGEKVGTKKGLKVDIAVDPIEGTRMVAMGQSNALTTIAIGEDRSFLKAPDMYMEKIVVGSRAYGQIDLNKTIEENIKIVAKHIGKKLSEFTVVILDKPRHSKIIKDIQNLGVRVFAIPDGDIIGAILTCMQSNDIDMLYGIGGAPEGVVSAVVIRALGGDMQGKLLFRKDVKGVTEETLTLSQYEKDRCDSMNIKVNQVLELKEIVKSDNIVFSATGITKGDLLKGIRKEDNIFITDTLVICGKQRIIRRIESTYY